MERCGLYIHVPFCVQKCNYCDFLSFTYKDELAEAYLLALFSELALLSEKYNHPEVQTIYLGGGTPTCLSGDKLAAIIDEVQTHFTVDLTKAEITCEMNPATARYTDLQAMWEAGINRLSIGVQSFDDRLLRKLGRVHDSATVVKTFEMVREVGFTNLNLDLIFAIPEQSRKDWQASLRTALELQPTHLSLYNLKIEEGTPFHYDYSEGRLVPVDEETDLWMYEEAISTLQAAGLEQYEISNFARPGFASRHNLTYWHYQPYLAVGPGAHGFDGLLRYENTGDLQAYIAAIEKRELPWEETLYLSWEDRMEEFMIMGLRLMEGVSLDEFQRRFGTSLTEMYGEKVDKLAKLGLVEVRDGRLALTKKGIPLGNAVFGEFLV